MKIERYKRPTSRFLSVDKDINFILEMFLSNERLKKLLYKTNSAPLDSDNLTELESVELLSKQYIKIMPKITVDNNVLNYIVISFDNFTPTVKNPEFRDNLVYIDILCHFDQWKMDGNELRPFRIAGEIDSMLEGARLSGIGVLEFIKANLLLINGEYGGLQIVYRAVHGEDDKKGFLNPQNEIKFLQDNGGNNG